MLRAITSPQRWRSNWKVEVTACLLTVHSNCPSMRGASLMLMDVVNTQQFWWPLSPKGKHETNGLISNERVWRALGESNPSCKNENLES